MVLGLTKISIKTILTLFLLALPLLISAKVLAATERPYFKIYGADTFTGGWFNNGATGCSNDPSTGSYQAPIITTSPPSITGVNKGGIFAYAQYNDSNKKSVGASSALAALALGKIEGDSSSPEPYGFSSDSSGYNNLSFANNLPIGGLSIAGYWGGFFEGVVPQTHCVPDYFTTELRAHQTPTDDTVTNLNDKDGQYLNNQSLVKISSSDSLDSGKNITYFIDGDAYINGNIKYSSSASYINPPKFALVVHGNIYIDPSVTQLDGWYIAQPLSNGTKGEFWTCHNGSTSLPTTDWVRDNCDSKLTINGAVVAKQFNLTRIQGNLALATNDETSSSSNVAEVIRYTPAMVAGAPFFKSTDSTTNNFSIDSLVSLPPVF